MLQSGLALVAVTLLSSLTLALPIEPSNTADAGSSHNLYLVTCAVRAGRNSVQNVSALAFFNTPITSNPVRGPPGGGGWDNDPKADQAALISNPAAPWEGTISASVWSNTNFTSSIDKQAGTLAKGNIAGSATLNKEQYICFKDGDTEIGIKEDNGDGRGDWGPGRGRGRPRVQCTADYWCASFDQGTVVASS